MASSTSADLLASGVGLVLVLWPLVAVLAEGMEDDGRLVDLAFFDAGEGPGFFPLYLDERLARLGVAAAACFWGRPFFGPPF